MSCDKLLAKYIGMYYENELRESCDSLFCLLIEDILYKRLGRSLDKRSLVAYYHIDDVYNVRIKDDNIKFDIDVSVNAVIDKYFKINGVHAYTTCECKCDDRFGKFKFSKPTTERQTLDYFDNKNSIPSDGYLVPEITRENREEYATKFLDKYTDGLAHKFGVVPIEKIATDTLGLIIDNTHELKEGVDGVLCLENDIIEIKEGFVTVPAYTILIDKNIKNVGRYRYTLCHEVMHYLLHRYFLILRKHIFNDMPSTNKIEKTANEEFYETRIECQAEYMPESILMPKHTFEEAYNNLIVKYQLDKVIDKEKALIKMIMELADTFQVSRKCVKIRINSLNLNTYGVELNNKMFETEYLTEEESIIAYLGNDELKAKFDKGTVVFIGNKFVHNDKKYVRNNKLTEYGYYHPSESTYTFERHTFRHYGFDNNIERATIIKGGSDVVAKKHHISSEDHTQLSGIETEDTYKDCYKSDIGATVKSLRKLTKMSQDDVCNESGVSKKKLERLEHGYKVDLTVTDYILIFKALNMPHRKAITYINKMTDGFEDTMENRLYSDVLIYDYHKCDIEELKSKLFNKTNLNRNLEEMNVLVND